MYYLLILPGALLAPILHEWVKAQVSAALGDPVPKNNGFLSWRPFKYFEPIGFLILMYTGCFGWGQPVPTSSFYYKDRRNGVILTYTAPIVANLLVGMLVAFLWSNFLSPHIGVWAIMNAGDVFQVRWFMYLNIAVLQFSLINIGFAVFNLISVFPMAGNKLMHLFASPDTSMRMNHYEKPMLMVFMLMVIFGIAQTIVFPIRNFFFNLVWF